MTLEKNSSLSGIYRRHSAEVTEIAGWRIAEYFGSPEKEIEHLRNQCVLVDWSHLGKISLSRGNAAGVAEKAVKGAGKIEILSSLCSKDVVALRLTRSDYLFLCDTGVEEKYLKKMNQKQTTVIDQTGAMACFALAGPRRDEVLERSTAVDLRRDRVGSGAVLQSTIHTVSFTLYRTAEYEILVHPRAYSEFLFDALVDVGMGVGMIPAGIGTLPVSLQKEAS